MNQVFKFSVIITSLLLTLSCDTGGFEQSSTKADKDSDENTKMISSEKKDNFKIISIKDEYELSIPKYMSKTTKLNEDASLQYQNIYKETYAIVIDEPKQEFIDYAKEVYGYDDDLTALENYATVQSSSLSNGCTIKNEPKTKELVINGLNASTYDFSASVTGVPADIAYYLTFIESEDKLYMMMVWTLDSRSETYESDFNKIRKSFYSVKG